MARKRKGPWQRKQDGNWYTTVGRKNIKLGTADEPYEIIAERYAEVLKNHQKPSHWTVEALIDEYLKWCKANKAPRTYEWYKGFLDEFDAGKMKAMDITPHYVMAWCNRRYEGCSNNTRHGAIRAIVRVFNWARKSGLIKGNPLEGVEKPTPEASERVVTAEQFALILSKIDDQELKDAFTFLWTTGCRPQELAIIEARHVQGRKVTLERKKSKGKKQRRVIYLNDVSAEIIERLMKKHPTGTLFRTMRGKPWNKNRFNCRVRVLRSRTGVDFSTYTLRHGFATAALESGMDSTTVGVLMGHADPSMVARVYQHLTQRDDYMIRAAQIAGTLPDGPQQ